MYDETAAMFTIFADLEGRDLPLYGELCRSSAADPSMMRLMAEAPKGQRRPVLLLAAVHDLFLAGAEHPLAAWYPTVSPESTVSGAPPLGDAYPAFADFVAEHRAEIVDALRHRTTQTNEVNRSCLWFAAVRDATSDLADRPIGLVEVGPSAGLNLGFDGYSYDFGDGRPHGDPTSAVELACEVRAGVPPIDVGLPPVAARVGFDIAPIDPTDEREVRWLEACIWPEQTVRFTRFAAAVRQTAERPSTHDGGRRRRLAGRRGRARSRGCPRRRVPLVGPDLHRALAPSGVRGRARPHRRGSATSRGCRRSIRAAWPRCRSPARCRAT